MKKDILTLTAAASEKIQQLLKQRNKPSLGIKICIKSGGCSGLSYKIEYADTVEKFDEVIEKEGFKLIIDPKAVMYLIGSKMDYTEDNFKSGFTFGNPNEKGRCGCGKSFHI